MNYFITGVSSGIGAALTRQLVASGHHVFGIGKRADALSKLKNELSNQKGTFQYLVGDVLDYEFLVYARNEFKQKLGAIEVLIPNAGYTLRGEMTQLTYEDYEHQINVNLMSVIKLVYLFFDELILNKGQIVFIGTQFTAKSLPGFTPYTISKMGIKTLADGLYYELKQKEVAVTLITPGFIASDIRNRDHRGNYTQDTFNQTPKFLEVKTQRAARVIIKAINKKKQEQVIGLHAIFIIFVMKYFPLVFDLFYNIYMKRISHQHK